MDLLHAENFRYVAAGGSLPTSGMDLVGGENAVIKASPEVIEHILASNPNSAERVVIGQKLEIEATLAAASLAEFPDFFGGSYSTGTYTLTQSVGVLSEYDCQFQVRKTDNSLVNVNVTYMNFIGDLDMALQQGDRFYLKVQAKSSNTSTLAISAAS